MKLRFLKRAGPPAPLKAPEIPANAGQEPLHSRRTTDAIVTETIIDLEKQS